MVNYLRKRRKKVLYAILCFIIMSYEFMTIPDDINIFIIILTLYILGFSSELQRFRKYVG